MTHFVAVHGAFRGAWYWEPLATALEPAGHTLDAVDLVGDTLDDWIDSLTSLTSLTSRTDPAGARTSVRQPGQFQGVEVGAAGRGVVLLGHSMGGVVVQAAPARLAGLVERLILLDSPLIGPGQRAVDVSGPAPPDDAQLPPREMQIPPSPVGPDQGFDDPELAEWVNRQLRPVPMGPQLDRVPDGVLEVPRTILFCGRTPDGYPSTFARRRCESEGIEHTVIEAHHDVAVLEPELLAAQLATCL